MVFGLENYIVNPYLRSLVILVLVFIVLKIVIFIIEKVILRFTAKTKTNIDDIFVKKASRPVTAIVLLIGLRIAIEELPLSETVEGVISKLIFSSIVIAFAFIVYLFVDIVLFVALKKTIRGESSAVRESLMSLIHSVLKVILVVLAGLYVLDIWGIEIGPFLAGLGIAGIAIAFAMQSSLSNIFGGVSMILDKTIKVGDLVYLDSETKGRILNIGLRSTRILTFDNELIIMPNSKIADSKVQNIGEPEPKSRVIIPFGVAYGSDIEKVKKIVLAEIKKVKHFVPNPEPKIRFLEMADSSLNLKAYFYVDSFEHRFDAIDESNTRIYNALNKNKIEIPFPQRDVHIKK
ncbi:MAG: mechanosensitive ion channel family protein [Nanoarchaeota archaeon]|nr:mechanosensitive ion channel family protein [Nanoarchaeota archaeon]